MEKLDGTEKLRSEKRKGNMISYEYRKQFPRANVKISFPKNKLCIQTRNNAEDNWYTFTDDDVKKYLPVGNAGSNQDNQVIEIPEGPQIMQTESNPSTMRWSAVISQKKESKPGAS